MDSGPSCLSTLSCKLISRLTATRGHEEHWSQLSCALCFAYLRGFPSSEVQPLDNRRVREHRQWPSFTPPPLCARVVRFYAPPLIPRRFSHWQEFYRKQDIINTLPIHFLQGRDGSNTSARCDQASTGRVVVGRDRCRINKKEENLQDIMG